MIKFIKKNKSSILAFIIPACLFILILLCLRIGLRYVVFTSDMQAQYISLFNYYKSIFNDPSSILYSFSNGIGGTMIGNIAYYLSSPLNLIILLFDKVNLSIGIIIILAIKFGLSGLFMYRFLNYNNKLNDKFLIMFSICYSLMIYSLAYYFHIMWLDAVFLAPLIMLGIDKILDNKSSLLYGASLFVAILSNYYMGYMLCIFACIYFIYKLVIKYNFKDNKKKILELIIKFGIISALAGFMTMFLLIPTFVELQNSIKNNDLNIVNSLKVDFNIFNILRQTISGEYGFANILNDKYQLIYCGSINVILGILYFLNSNINKKEKIMTFLVYLIFIFSFSINLINFIWHGFNIPSCFEYRYAFLFCFFNIYIACRSFNCLKNVKIEKYLIALIIFLIINIVNFYRNITYYNYIIIILVILYLIIIYLLNNFKDKSRIKDLRIILVFLVIGELFFSGFITLRDFEYTTKEEYNDYINIVGKNIDNIRNNDRELYRVEKNFFYSRIDSLLLNYNGLDNFISTINKDTLQFFNNVGSIHYTNSYIYGSNKNKFLDSILNVKYYISNSEKSYSDYEKINSFEYSISSGLFYDVFKEEHSIFKNNNNLGMAFMISDDYQNYIEYIKENNITDYIGFQNMLYSTMLNTDDLLFKKLNYKILHDNEFEIEIINDSDIYITLNYQLKSDDDSITIKVNDNDLLNINRYNNGQIIIKNNYQIGDKIKIELVKSNSNFELYQDKTVYYLDDSAFDSFYEKLSKNKIQISSYKNNYIKGTIEVSENNTLFTSIPYDKGWNIYVDGKKVDSLKIYNTFLGIKLQKGYHEIEFKYYPSGLKLGIIISIISFFLFVLYIKFEKWFISLIMNIYNKFEEIIDYLIIGVLTTLISIITYWIFAKLFNVDYMISNVISWIISVTFAYITNKIIVFKSKFTSGREMLKELYQFVKYRIFSLIIDILIMYLFVSVIRINDIVSKVIVQIVVIILNYFFSKLFIFKKDENKGVD